MALNSAINATANSNIELYPYTDLRAGSLVKAHVSGWFHRGGKMVSLRGSKLAAVPAIRKRKKWPSQSVVVGCDRRQRWCLTELNCASHGIQRLA
jgi:hypothetical protein